eukprot:TRINITY_DN22881_c0_g1_i2.p1 TRINITY_DN22881_c0_g1~~TRINITY_DN22881_c0_g1_i2.p1  ORF type:complete len:301 (-),score=30.16 TRINITY_DN22881_c0_g1_i2:416-1261(-)
MDSISGKVLVIGATGKVGQHVVKELRTREIEVRVMVRSLDSVTHGDGGGSMASPTDFFTDKVGRAPLLVSDPGIETVQGNVTDRDAVCRAAEGVTAVIDVHGVAPLRLSRFSDLWSDPKADLSHPASVNFLGVQNVVAACQKNGVKRLVRLTGLSVAMSARSPVVMFFNLLLSFTTKWHRRSEICIRESGINYTIVQPSGLKDTPKAAEAGSVLLLQCEASAATPSLPPATGISRLDVASLCVEALCSKTCKSCSTSCSTCRSSDCHLEAYPPGCQHALIL